MPNLQDIRYLSRLTWRSPGLSFTTLFVIVLGLSLFLTCYTFTSQTMREPMPFPAGDRYVFLGANSVDSGLMLRGAIHDANSFRFLRDNASSFTVLGAYDRGSAVADFGDVPLRATRVAISPELLAATAVEPQLGRLFGSADARGDADAEVLLSQDFWQQFLAGDEAVIGRTLQLDGVATVIAGVMPAGFGFPRGSDLWTPLRIGGGQDAEALPVTLVGILEPGLTTSDAMNETGALMAQFRDLNPAYQGERAETVYPYGELFPWGFSIPDIYNYISWLILSLVVINLSALLLVRLFARNDELVIRAALGANGWDLARLILLESFVYCASGLLLALAISSALLQLMRLSWGTDMAYWVDFQLDTDAVAIAALTTLTLWLVSTVAACYRAYSSATGEVRSLATEAASKHRQGRSAQSIVLVEIIVSSFLLVVCGVAMYFLYLTYNTDLGVETEDVTVASFRFPVNVEYDEARRMAYLAYMEEAMQTIPGVSATGIASALPHRMGRRGNLTLEDALPNNSSSALRQSTISVSDRYFEMFDLDPIQGRMFDGGDHRESLPVAIVSAELAQQLWPDEPAIGKRLSLDPSAEEPWLTVVGVIPTILQNFYNFETLPSVYRPLSQSLPEALWLAIKTDPEIAPSDIEAEIRSLGADFDRNIPIEAIRSLDEQFIRDLQGLGGYALLIGEFTLATLVLAAVGIFAVVTRAVLSRTREIGIRKALGSSDRLVAARFLLGGMAYLLAGLLLGAVPAIALATVYMQIMAPIGEQVVDFMPVITFASVLLVSCLVLLATYAPARSALNLEPGDALRYE